MTYTILINLVPTCVKCGSPVTDSLEAEVKNSSDSQREIKVGVATPADVSPNTPKADEADL